MDAIVASSSSTKEVEPPPVTDQPLPSSSPSSQPSQANEQQPNTTNPSSSEPSVLYGFDTLNEVQRYAVGALSAVHLTKGQDMNSLAFARDYMIRLFKALGLREGQIEALLALQPEPDVIKDVVQQCVSLVGDDASRFQAIQAMLALAVVGGVYDSRARAFLGDVAIVFNVDWIKVAAVELAIAVELVRRMEDGNGASEGKREKSAAQYLNARRRKKKKRYAAAKVGGITLVGGVLFGLTGGLIAPALLASLAGIGVAGAAGLAATGTVTSGAVVASLFGVAGAGLTGKKAKKRMGMSVSEFRFEHQDDPRILYQRQFKELKDPAWLVQQKKNAEEGREVLENGVGLGMSRSDSHAMGDNVTNMEDVLETSSQGRLSYSNSLPSISTNASARRDSDLRSSFSSSNDGVPMDGQVDPMTIDSKDLDQNYDGLTRAPLSNPSLHLVVTVPAWLESRRAGSALAQFTCVQSQLPFSQHASLRWEARRLYEMSKAFAKFWASKATVTTIQQAYPHMVAAASSVAGAVAFAIALPLTVISCLDYIDNPWSVLVSRSNGAGEQLADELTLRAYGNRPVTLVGYSLGARVIFKALESLAARKATGIVADVFLIGAPVTAEPARWEKVSGVVAGRLVNGYCPHDWALAYFHRGCGHGIYVAGLRKVVCDSVINMNLAFIGVGGHRWLKNAMGRAAKAMGVSTGKIEMAPAPLVIRGAKKESVLEDGDELAANTKFDDFDEASGSEDVMDEGSVADSVDNDSMLSEDTAGNAVGAEEERGKKRKKSSRKPATANAIKKKASSAKSWLWGSWNKKKSPREEIKPQVNGHCETEIESGLRKTGSANVNGTLSNEQPSSSVLVAEGQLLDLESDEQDDAQTNDSSDFDWELQRRLWAEQERQIANDPTGQAALTLTVDDLAPSAAVLNVGIEITGRRLRTFVTQDQPFPTSHEEVFTNCLDEQSVLVVNVYEYMPKTKTLPLSMEKYYRSAEAANQAYEKEERAVAQDKDDTNNVRPTSVSVYPKLLEELRLEWPELQPKGSLRFRTTMEFTEDGDLTVKVEANTESNGEKQSMKACIEHGKLCSIRERKVLEERERKKAESKKKKKRKAQVKAITSGKPEVLSLPGPESLPPLPMRDAGLSKADAGGKGDSESVKARSWNDLIATQDTPSKSAIAF